MHAYGDLLDRWQLYHKRLELLKSVKRRTVAPGNLEIHGIGISFSLSANPTPNLCPGFFRKCKKCTAVLPEKVSICSSCNVTNSMAKCSICRLPVKGMFGPLEPIAILIFSGDDDAGLLKSCLYCFHVTHISCWSSLNVPICPTGCGCICNGLEEMQTRPSSRLGINGLSPRPTPLLLPFP